MAKFQFNSTAVQRISTFCLDLFIFRKRQRDTLRGSPQKKKREKKMTAWIKTLNQTIEFLKIITLSFLESYIASSKQLQYVDFEITKNSLPCRYLTYSYVIGHNFACEQQSEEVSRKNLKKIYMYFMIYTQLLYIFYTHLCVIQWIVNGDVRPSCSFKDKNVLNISCFCQK